MKFLILLLALKGLMPSKQTRKKWAKRKKRAQRIYRLTASTRKERRKPKKMGFFKKAKLIFNSILFLCISIPLVAFGFKAYKTVKKLAAKLPKKAIEPAAQPDSENPEQEAEKKPSAE